MGMFKVVFLFISYEHIINMAGNKDIFYIYAKVSANNGVTNCIRKAVSYLEIKRISDIITIMVCPFIGIFCNQSNMNCALVNGSVVLLTYASRLIREMRASIFVRYDFIFLSVSTPDAIRQA